MGDLWAKTPYTTRFTGVLALITLSLVLALTGCDQQRIEGLEEGVATEADVRAKFGEPEQVWDGENGERIFEYNRQPAGHRNYMISIGTDGRMTALRQVLTPENFATIKPGMMMEEVRKKLGKPMRVIPYALKQETYYNWRYLEDSGNTSVIFSVVMDKDLRVLRTERTLEANSTFPGTNNNK
jgi:hypothetical protein